MLHFSARSSNWLRALSFRSRVPSLFPSSLCSLLYLEKWAQAMPSVALLEKWRAHGGPDLPDVKRCSLLYLPRPGTPSLHSPFETQRFILSKKKLSPLCQKSSQSRPSADWAAPVCLQTENSSYLSPRGVSHSETAEFASKRDPENLEKRGRGESDADWRGPQRQRRDHSHFLNSNSRPPGAQVRLKISRLSVGRTQASQSLSPLPKYFPHRSTVPGCLKPCPLRSALSKKRLLEEKSASVDLVSSWGFSAWRDGLNVRYSVYLLICLFLVVLQLSTLIINFKFSERSLSNVSYLFHGQFEGFELDGRLLFSCHPRSFR